MRSWPRSSTELTSTPSPATPVAAELLDMRRRFVEALRRAEIISLVSGAANERELGRLLSEELCEVFDAEVGMVVHLPADEPARAIGVVGVDGRGLGRMLVSKEIVRAAEADRAVVELGTDLLGVGGRSTLISCHRGSDGRTVLGVARLYEQGFDAAEVALLEAVAVSTGQALERLWALEEREELIGRLKRSLIGTAEALANALEAKDHYTADHATEVADMAVRVGRELGLGDRDLEELRYGAIFHDIGKIAIPDAILNKPGPLNQEEREVMMRHPEIGEQIVAPIPFLSNAVRKMVRHDHEHWDGKGYPDGLAGERIPLGARIILVVDGYHAMTSDRPYRRAMSHADALEELRRNAGSQFDPTVIEAFMRIYG